MEEEGGDAVKGESMRPRRLQGDAVVEVAERGDGQARGNLMGDDGEEEEGYLGDDVCVAWEDACRHGSDEGKPGPGHGPREVVTALEERN